MSTMKAAAFVLNVVLLTTTSPECIRAQSEPWATVDWSSAHVTNYGNQSGLGDSTESMGGACGFTDMQKYGFGVNNTAVSVAMFDSGFTCGACFEIKCDEASSAWCIKNGTSIYPTATNLCPEDSNKPNDNGGWCNRPRVHFDLAYPLFIVLATYEAGIVPVLYRRVPCYRQGGVRFTIDNKTNDWWLFVKIYNMADWGTAANISVQLSGSADWYPMNHNYGAEWDYQSNGTIFGLSVSFTITLDNGTDLVVMNEVPVNWSIGATYEAGNALNFLA